MRKKIALFTFYLIATLGDALATTRDAQLTNTTGYNYNYMYPYMNNQMRDKLNPGVTPSYSDNPINAVVRTYPIPSNRRVVPRKTINRSATQQPTSNSRIQPASYSVAQPRRVVARSAQKQTFSARGSRADNSYTIRTAQNTPLSTTTGTTRISSARCLADYTACMNNYCERPNTPYDKCYCSSKLSQIDAQYKPAIDSLFKQILTIGNTNQWTDEEMNEYWMSKIGQYTGDDNSFINIDNSLNINWVSMESKVRGQNAFTTGHDYCVQHLYGCVYMANNLRDAYRSEISRDCATYENGLRKIKNAAESIIEANK